MWFTGGMGIALKKEMRLAIPLEGEGREVGGEGKERGYLPQLTFQFLMSSKHSFLNRINIWKWFKGQHLVVCQQDLGNGELEGI